MLHYHTYGTCSIGSDIENGPSIIHKHIYFSHWSSLKYGRISSVIILFSNSVKLVWVEVLFSLCLLLLQSFQYFTYRSDCWCLNQTWLQNLKTESWYLDWHRSCWIEQRKVLRLLFFLPVIYIYTICMFSSAASSTAMPTIDWEKTHFKCIRHFEKKKKKVC